MNLMKKVGLAVICVAMLQVAACDNSSDTGANPSSRSTPSTDTYSSSRRDTNLSSRADANAASRMDANARNRMDANMSTRTDTNAGRDTTTYDRDNTGVNQRDRASDTVTADQQGQNKSDVQLSADIRKRVVGLDNLSTNAKNTKIIVTNGKVTLRGPVKSQEEKDTIGRVAADVVGAGNVDNQLEIEANP